jgi:hypothetical protein
VNPNAEEGSIFVFSKESLGCYRKKGTNKEKGKISS